jgi:hypothetical protein
MNPSPVHFINCILAFAALIFYILGSYRFYKSKQPFLIYIGIALIIDISTAILASFKITPTLQIPETTTVPYQSVLFIIHIVLATAGILGFIIMFIYLLIKGVNKPYIKLRKYQFLILLPVWLVGEGIAIINALSKICFRYRIFELF